MVGCDRVGDRLQHHRLAGTRRRDDQSALTLADRHQHVHDTAGVVVLGRFELRLLLRIERGQVVEEDLVARLFRRLEVDCVNLD